MVGKLWSWTAIVCALIAISTTVIHVEGYIVQQRGLHSSRSFRLKAKPDSYKQALEQARLAKAQKSGSPAASVPQVRQPVAPRVAPVQQTAPDDEEEEDNGLPFSDEMYDHLKFVIGKLSTRMKDGVPLSQADLTKFELSCDAIIRDAKKPLGLPTSGTSF
jgi:hypothetical protein